MNIGYRILGILCKGCIFMLIFQVSMTNCTGKNRTTDEVGIFRAYSGLSNWLHCLLATGTKLRHFYQNSSKLH